MTTHRALAAAAAGMLLPMLCPAVAHAQEPTSAPPPAAAPTDSPTDTPTESAPAAATADASAADANGLAVTNISFTDFPAVVLTGAPLTALADVGPLRVIDSRAELSNGWSLTVSATPFKEWSAGAPVDGGHALPAGSLLLTSPASAQPINGTTSAPPAVVDGQFAIDAGTTVELATASTGEGLGEYMLDFPQQALRLTVPADAYAVQYTSEITVSLAAGPSMAAPTITADAVSAEPGDGYATVSWPASDPATVGSYEVSTQPTGQSATLGLAAPYVAAVSGDDQTTVSIEAPECGGQTCSLVVPGLTNGTDYTVTVTAKSDSGTSPVGDAVTVRPVAPPPAPQDTGAEAGDAQVDVVWDAVESTDAAPVDGYVVYVDGVEEETLPAGSTDYTVEDLENEREYAIAVRARGPGGESKENGPLVKIAPRAPQGTPDAPVLVDATPGDGEVTVAWDYPGEAEAFYVYVDGGVGQTTVPAGSTSAVVTGLANGSEYTLRVAAVGAGGESKPSNPMTVVPQPADTEPLDEEFGDDGTLLAGDDTTAGRSVVTLEDGSVLVGGTWPQFAVAKYNADGELDKTFGDGGFVYGPWPEDGSAETLTLDGQGRIVAAGHVLDDDGQPQAVVVRFTPTGELDDRFADGGATTLGCSPEPQRGTTHAVEVTPDDGVLVAASSVEGDERTGCAVLLTSKGEPDAEFGEEGLADLGPDAPTEVSDLALDDDGGAILVGTTRDDDGEAIVVTRLGDDGTPDSDFGEGGSATYTAPDDQRVSVAGVTVTDGVTVVAGAVAGDRTWGVVAFDADGAPAEDFGENGAVVWEDIPAGAAPTAVTALPDGGFAVVGQSSGADRDMLVVKAGADGELDESFGEDGWARTDTTRGRESARAVTSDEDGALVVVGQTGGKDSKAVVARYHP